MNNPEPVQKPSSEHAPQRAPRPSRRRLVLVFFSVFSAVSSASLLYTFSRPKVYEAEAVAGRYHLENIFREGSEPVIPEIIYQRVAERLVAWNSPTSKLPYDHSILNNPPALTSKLKENTSIVSALDAYCWGFRVRHPNAEWAALIANLFVEECVALNARQIIDEAMVHIQKLETARSAHQLSPQQLKEELASLPNNAPQRVGIEARIRTEQTKSDQLTDQMRNFVESGIKLDSTSARIVDRATVPAEGDHFRPHLARDLGLGASAALLSALGTCLFVRRKHRSA